MADTGGQAAPAPGLMSAPAAKLETVVTYLEMTEAPTGPPPPRPVGKLALSRIENPEVDFYRFIYGRVGAPWLWYERQLLDDETLARIIGDPAVEIYVLYVDGAPVGFSELDWRAPPRVEMAYLGLMPDFIGRGLGRTLLRLTIDAAWSRHPERLWLHTCTLDHPDALRIYRRAGFVPYRQETAVINDPRQMGILTG